MHSEIGSCNPEQPQRFVFDDGKIMGVPTVSLGCGNVWLHIPLEEWLDLNSWVVRQASGTIELNNRIDRLLRSVPDLSPDDCRCVQSHDAVVTVGCPVHGQSPAGVGDASNIDTEWGSQ
jgi:hypothetical protein